MGISSRLSCTTCKSRTDNLTSNGADLPRFGEILATPGIRFTRGSSFFFHPLRELPGFQFRVEVGLDRDSAAGNDQDSFGQESGDGNVAEALVFAADSESHRNDRAGERLTSLSRQGCVRPGMRSGLNNK